MDVWQHGPWQWFVLVVKALWVFGLGRRCSSRAQALRATGRLWHAWAMEAVLSTRASHQSRGSTGWTREGQNKAGMPGWARERGSEGARARGLGAADRCGGSLIRLRVAGLVLAAHTLSSRHAGSTKKPSCVLVGRSEGADERGAGIHCTRTTATTTTTTTTTTDCTTALAPPPLAPSPPPSPPPPPTPLGPDAAAGSQAPPALAYLKPRRARVKPRLAPLDWLRGPVARIGTGRGSSQVVLRNLQLPPPEAAPGPPGPPGPPHDRSSLHSLPRTSPLPEVAMATHATITFSQPGVRPPVYVTSSLSGWTPLEMDVADNTTASGDPVFTKTFSNVDQGSYQYKVRLGQDHWILDESKQTATDDQGIRNNVIHVEPAAPEPSQSSAPDSTPTQATTSSDAPAPPSHEPALKRLDSRKDSTMDQDQLPIPPPDLERDAKQTAKVDSSTEPGVLEPPHAPIVVVDKVDAQPTSAEDATEDATAAQQTAHDTKATDALPDKVEAVPQHHVGPGTGDEQAAPLLHHESSQADPSPLPPSMDTIDEESTPSSADHTSSGDAMDTPSELDEGDELNLVPLLSHETSVGQESNGLANVPLFGHESETGNHHANQVPPLPHESNLPDDAAVTTDSDGGDELDRFPLLEHEGKSSAYKGDEIVAKNHHLGGQGSRLDRPHSNHGESGNYPEGDDGDAPLLPHEREAETADHAGSVSSQDYAPFPTEKQSAFSYETEGAQNLFGGPGRYDFFKTRKNSSLPHRLPRSDAEDEDLNDPSLERFPTNRDLILQRVASIGAELPEDEATHEHPCSPQPSVFSQACSSVDLVPVKSYTSLASVPEADDSDEEDDQHDTHDLDSLPSPIYIGKNHLRVSNPPSGFARDPNATPIINASKQLGDIMQAKDEDSSEHAKEPIGQAKSINGHDGAQDGSKSTNTLRDAISLPTKATASPPMSDLNATTEALHPVPNTDSELRQRKGLAEEPSQDTDAPGTAAKDTTTSKDKVENTVPSLASLHQPEKHSGSPLKLLFGDRKRASASALVIGGALAAYYYMSAKP